MLATRWHPGGGHERASNPRAILAGGRAPKRGRDRRRAKRFVDSSKRTAGDIIGTGVVQHMGVNIPPVTT